MSFRKMPCLSLPRKKKMEHFYFRNIQLASLPYFPHFGNHIKEPQPPPVFYLLAWGYFDVSMIDRRSQNKGGIDLVKSREYDDWLGQAPKDLYVICTTRKSNA